MRKVERRRTHYGVQRAQTGPSLPLVISIGFLTLSPAPPGQAAGMSQTHLSHYYFIFPIAKTFYHCFTERETEDQKD
jgi:hypothetical protein